MRQSGRLRRGERERIWAGRVVWEGCVEGVKVGEKVVVVPEEAIPDRGLVRSSFWQGPVAADRASGVL